MIFKEWFKKRNLNEAGYGSSEELDPKIQKAICKLRLKDMNVENGFDLSSIKKELVPASGKIVLTGEQLIELYNSLILKWKSIKGIGEKAALYQDRADAANVFGRFLQSVGEKEDFLQQLYTIRCEN
jgi:hypothetical protein